MNRLSLRATLLALIVASLGSLGSYYLSTQVNNQLQEQKYTKIEGIAKQINISMQESIDIAVHDLQALQAFYGASNLISIEEFNEYMHILDIENRAHIQALSWIPLILAKQRESFENEFKKYYKNFSITELNKEGQFVTRQKNPYYLPVNLIAPYSNNKRAQGFDLNSSSTRRESLEYASTSGYMTTTARIRLVQETGDSYGVLIIAPVYQSHASLMDAGQRKKLLKGYVTGVFRIDNIIENALNLANKENLVLSLLDTTEQDNSSLYGKKNIDTLFEFNLSIPNRQWQLQVLPNETLQAYFKSISIALWVLIGGITVSILLALCYYILQAVIISKHNINNLRQQLQGQNEVLEITVEERTKTLEDNNQLLHSNVEKLTAQGLILTSLMEDTQIAKEAAEQKTIELTKTNRDLDEFAYIASHDLKAPLRGIDQLASWVVEDLETGDMKDIPENLSLMRQRVQRLEALLNDLLAYSRANKQTNTSTTVNSREIVEDAFALLFAPPDFTLSIQGEMPTFTTMSPPFEQVIRNLLANAIKHHDRSDGKIQVNCCERRSYYEFSVTDDGPGISPDHHQQIFKMFKTLKTRDDVEGSGMGLALIKKIVEYYKGKVHLESSLEKGSTFSFTWPKKL